MRGGNNKQQNKQILFSVKFVKLPKKQKFVKIQQRFKESIKNAGKKFTEKLTADFEGKPHIPTVY